LIDRVDTGVNPLVSTTQFIIMNNKDRLIKAAFKLTESYNILCEGVITLSKVRKSLLAAQEAVCALNALEQSLNGVPEPKLGDK
jgi:hypothetical protein